MLTIPQLVRDGGVGLRLLHLVLRGDDVLGGREGSHGGAGGSQVLRQ